MKSKDGASASFIRLSRVRHGAVTVISFKLCLSGLRVPTREVAKACPLRIDNRVDSAAAEDCVVTEEEVAAIKEAVEEVVGECVVEQ
jgi:hypothetical protein